MADYAKISVKGVFSKNSDYSFPKATFAPLKVSLIAETKAIALPNLEFYQQ